MSVAVSNVRVGEPVRFQSLSVFPLFDGHHVPVEYLLSDEGIGSGSVTVEEVSEAGSVPDLLVENKGDLRVLFLEGEQLIGAKQNRVLNTSVLIAAHSKIKIPVSCVEQGRWRVSFQAFRLQRYALVIQAEVLSQNVGEQVGHREAGPSLRPQQSLGGGRSSAEVPRYFRHGRDVRYI